MKRGPNDNFETESGRVSKRLNTESTSKLKSSLNWLISWISKPTPEENLFIAIQNDDLDTIKTLSTVANLNARFSGPNKEPLLKDMTPLHFAIQLKKTEIAQIIIDAGADLETQYNSMTPLHFAISSKQKKMSRILLEAGADTNTLYCNMSPLHHAISENNLYTVEALINAGADTECFYDQKTALHLALDNNNIKIIQALITAKANVNALCDDMSPLHVAIKMGQPQIVRALIKTGADKERLYKGMRPLHYAVKLGKTPVVQALLKAGSDKESLYNDMTPLHFAVKCGAPKIAQALLTAGANKEALFDDITPLHFAIERNDMAMTKVLISAGADVDKLYNQLSPLHYSIQLKQIEIAKALIAAGANKEHRYQNMTPLLYSIYLEEAEISQALVAAGADKESLYNKMTPLHYCIEKGNMVIAHALILAGANKNTPFHILQSTSDSTLIETLLPFCLVEEIQLSALVSDQNYFSTDSRRRTFLRTDNPMRFLTNAHLISPVKLAALQLLNNAKQVKQYENALIADDESAMADSKTLRANWHFKNKVEPYFTNALTAVTTVNENQLYLMAELPESGPEDDKIYIGLTDQNQFIYTRRTSQGYVINDLLDIFLDKQTLMNHETLAQVKSKITNVIRSSDPLTIIEKQIRDLLLNKMLEQAIAEQDQVTIEFINRNKLKLIQADSNTLLASCSIFTKAHAAQAAWRGYNPYAPVSGNWPNLLTIPSCNEKIFSTRASHQGELRADSAYAILRKRVALYFLAVIDAKDGDDNTRASRITNFIAQLAEIRNAHGPDDPSCYPGTLTRCANMGAFHSIAQLPENTKELIADYLKERILTAFQMELAALEGFTNKEKFYHALSELTTEQAMGIIYHPERYENDWLAIRQNFIQGLGTTNEILEDIFINERSPIVIQDSVYIDQNLMDVAGGANSTALADYFERHTNKVPTSIEIQHANPFKDKDSIEHKICEAMLSTILETVSIYANSLQRLNNLSVYLEKKVPELLKGASLKSIIENLDIEDERLAIVLTAVTSALKNIGWNEPVIINNPFDATVKQMQQLVNNIPPSRAQPYRSHLTSAILKQKYFNEYLPLVQQAFQKCTVNVDFLVRVTKALAMQLVDSNAKFCQDEFFAFLDNEDALYMRSFKQQLNCLAIKLNEGISQDTSLIRMTR